MSIEALALVSIALLVVVLVFAGILLHHLSATRREVVRVTSQRDVQTEFLRNMLRTQTDSLGTLISTTLAGQNDRLEKIRDTVDTQLGTLRTDNAQQLEVIRQTVDEKLQSTLEKRLNDSFALVGEQLERVHKGLGDMQGLAAGVGDLKKVLSNVRTRGILGEIQLGALLDEILAPEQYATNVATRPGSSERVEFAIRLPGRGAECDVVFLPIDAKFPQEDYVRLVDAYESGDAVGIEQVSRALEQRLRSCAQDIRNKYIHPPHTTDIGIMFLATEGLYAEVARRPGLIEMLQRERVMVAGPSTLAALLNALQMGFRTLAIEQRAAEVRETLVNVKTEFSKFGSVLDKVQKKLQEASSVIDKAQVRKRAVERKLRAVESMPAERQLAGADDDVAESDLEQQLIEPGDGDEPRDTNMQEAACISLTNG